MNTKNQEENRELSQEENQEQNLETENLGIKGIATVEDLMDLLYVTRQTLVKYIKGNKIPAYKVGKGKYLISTEELIKTIKDNSGDLKI